MERSGKHLYAVVAGLFLYSPVGAGFIESQAGISVGTVMAISVAGAFISASVGFAGSFAALERTGRTRLAGINIVANASAPSRSGAGLMAICSLIAGTCPGLAVAPTWYGRAGALPLASSHIAGIAARLSRRTCRLRSGAGRARRNFRLRFRQSDVAYGFRTAYHVSEAAADIAAAA